MDLQVKPTRAARSAKPSPVLKRETFTTSRQMDFFSERELVAQTGHPLEDWPLVILKEAIDNALDACEEADTPPVVEIVADECGISVRDNADGIPADTIHRVLDFTTRTSNREMYVSPTRGSQGNALKTLAAMPRVIDPQRGRLIVESRGIRHEITCQADPVTQEAIVADEQSASLVGAGTKIHVEWSPASNGEGRPRWPFGNKCLPTAISTGEAPSIRALAESLLRGFTFFNPHLSLTVRWFGEEWKAIATDGAWQNWRPNKPTSAHWYESRHLERLIGAYIGLDRKTKGRRTVASFLAEFDGLAGTQKRKLVIEESGLGRAYLDDLATETGFRSDRIERLLVAMKRHTKPVKTNRIGVIGRDHLTARLCEQGALEESIEYRIVQRVDQGIPFVLESAFGWLGDEAQDQRRIFAGANWSAAINNPFRSFGQTGEGLEAMLREQRAGGQEPIVFLLHLAQPRVEFADRGKSSLVVRSAHASEK